jgi:hypothetical protein
MVVTHESIRHWCLKLGADFAVADRSPAMRDTPPRCHLSLSWPAASQAIDETRAEFLASAPNGLIGDHNPTLSDEQLNIAQAEAEHAIQPHGVADDLGGNRWR